MEKTEATTTSKETIEILNDLVAINNDRIEGYERALDETEEKDSDIRRLFIAMIDESRKLRLNLANEVQTLGGKSETGTTASGKLYRAWMDVKAVFTGHDRHTVLANCERGEDAAQKAYKDALEDNNLPAYIRTMLTEQKQQLRASHDRVKALRDAAK
ncbi:PA2169 family four-helix-bundle protein [Chryseolinea sp. T2]|uniref:PA2169 family four-helix-bundle protein n=1 Tax=Chryseolinea sp. T2 TaxID=3129255 RepID=UPI0030768A85